MQAQLNLLVDEYERGRCTRRELIHRLAALAALGGVLPHAVAQTTAPAPRPDPTFTATDLNHIALSVTDVQRSRRFYERHLGLRTTSDGGQSNCFMTTGRGWLALFRGENPGLHHYCYTIDDYDPDRAVATLKAAGLEPDRRGNRVYFDDPDGLVVQVAASNR